MMLYRFWFQKLPYKSCFRQLEFVFWIEQSIVGKASKEKNLEYKTPVSLISLMPTSFIIKKHLN